MNNGQIGSYYDNAYLSYDAGKFQQTGQQNGVAESAKVNLPVNNAVVTASDSAPEAQEVTAGQFISNVLKEAGITQSDRTMQLVQNLLSQQQPVDKNTLTMFNRLIKMFPDADVQTIVHMKLNNIPINQEMIAQYEQYSNNANYIMKDLAAITDGLGDVLRSLAASAGKEAAVGQLESIATLVKEMSSSTGGVGIVSNTVQQQSGEGSLVTNILGQNLPEGAENSVQAGQATGIGTGSLAYMEMNSLQGDLSAVQNQEQMISQNPASTQLLEGQAVQNFQQPSEQGGQNLMSAIVGNTDNVNNSSANPVLPGEILQMLDSLEQEASEIAKGEVKTDGTFLEKLTTTLKQMPKGTEGELFKLLEKDDVKKAVRDELENALLLEPKDAAELEKVQKYYKKLQGALENYISMAERQTEAASQSINKTFQNMSDNLNFMHYVNEMMPYIQLPLKLLDENAHGDFYVMRNKKNKVENPDEFTAFLRLNMENLGELDVFIKLRNKAADIAFQVEKQGVCEFVEENISRLETGLANKGIGLTAHVSKKEEEFSFVKDIIEGEASGTIEKYSFDMMM